MEYLSDNSYLETFEDIKNDLKPVEYLGTTETIENKGKYIDGKFVKTHEQTIKHTAKIKYNNHFKAFLVFYNAFVSDYEVFQTLRSAKMALSKMTGTKWNWK